MCVVLVCVILNHACCIKVYYKFIYIVNNIDICSYTVVRICINMMFCTVIYNCRTHEIPLKSVLVMWVSMAKYKDK